MSATWLLVHVINAPAGLRTRPCIASWRLLLYI